MPTDRMKVSLILALFFPTTLFSVYFVKEKLTALEQSMLCHYEEPSSEGLFIKTFANNLCHYVGTMINVLTIMTCFLFLKIMYKQHKERVEVVKS